MDGERRHAAPDSSWIRVVTLAGASGWPAVLAMAGHPRLPVELAEAEAARLRNVYHARVLRDLGGYPCVRLGEPEVTAWLAGLDERVAETSAAIERQLEASREPILIEIDHAGPDDG